MLIRTVFSFLELACGFCPVNSRDYCCCWTEFWIRFIALPVCDMPAKYFLTYLSVVFLAACVPYLKGAGLVTVGAG